MSTSSYSVSDISIGMNVSFTIYNAISGKTKFTGDIVGILAGSAVSIAENPDINHLNIYPAIPTSRKKIYDNDYTSYKYFIINNETDDTTYYIGFAWIEEASIVVNSDVRLDVVILPFDDTTTADIEDIMEQKGYTVSSATITTVTDSTDVSEASDLEVGMDVSFTITTGIDGQTDYTGTVASIISGVYVPDTSDASDNHDTIYPNLSSDKQSEYSDDYTSYNYIMLAEDDGSTVYIGVPWIEDSTITVSGTKELNLAIYPFHDETVAAVTLILKQYGYTVDSISITQTS